MAHKVKEKGESLMLIGTTLTENYPCSWDEALRGSRGESTVCDNFLGFVWLCSSWDVAVEGLSLDSGVR